MNTGKISYSNRILKDDSDLLEEENSPGMSGGDGNKAEMNNIHLIFSTNGTFSNKRTTKHIIAPLVKI